MARTFKGAKGFTPKAVGYSAQSIADVTSEQGKSQLNEELRRIDEQLKIKNDTPIVTPVNVVQPSSSNTQLVETPQKISQRLTVKHNNEPVITLVVETIDFQDSSSVLFDVIPISPKEVDITARTAESGLYKAKRVGQILYSFDGRTFKRGLPLTSYRTGIILNRDGVIMITGKRL